MTDYTSRVALGDYQIVFSTTNEKDFNLVQSLVRLLIDLNRSTSELNNTSIKQEDPNES